METISAPRSSLANALEVLAIARIDPELRRSRAVSAAYSGPAEQLRFCTVIGYPFASH